VHPAILINFIICKRYPYNLYRSYDPYEAKNKPTPEAINEEHEVYLDDGSSID